MTSIPSIFCRVWPFCPALTTSIGHSSFTLCPLCLLVNFGAIINRLSVVRASYCSTSMVPSMQCYMRNWLRHSIRNCKRRRQGVLRNLQSCTFAYIGDNPVSSSVCVKRRERSSSTKALQSVCNCHLSVHKCMVNFPICATRFGSWPITHWFCAPNRKNSALCALPQFTLLLCSRRHSNSAQFPGSSLVRYLTTLYSSLITESF